MRFFIPVYLTGVTSSWLRFCYSLKVSSQFFTT
jgi:hypothetical protein